MSEARRIAAAAERDAMLAPVPDPARHASLGWSAVESGAPERTRAMLRSLGLTVVRDHEQEPHR